MKLFKFRHFKFTGIKMKEKKAKIRGKSKKTEKKKRRKNILMNQK